MNFKKALLPILAVGGIAAVAFAVMGNSNADSKESCPTTKAAMGKKDCPDGKLCEVGSAILAGNTATKKEDCKTMCDQAKGK